MKNLLRIMLEGAFGNFKRIFFASDRVTDIEMRENILQGKVKPKDKVAIDACIGCSGCANVCPTGAVTMVDLDKPEELMDGWTKTQIPKLNSENVFFAIIVMISVQFTRYLVRKLQYTLMMLVK